MPEGIDMDVFAGLAGRSQTASGLLASTGRPIYLDYHSTTPVDPRVATVVVRAMTEAFGNANSVDHAFGEEAAELVTCAREQVAALVNTDPDSVHFTSGSSEGIRLAIRHAVSTRRNTNRPLRVAASSVEHRAVLDALNSAQRGDEAVVRLVPVDSNARLSLDGLRDACSDGVDLICVMAANNEVGTLYPIEEVALIAENYGARTLVDATQAVGHLAIQASAWRMTYLTLSAHKIYGPKGVGAVVTTERAFRASHSSVLGVGEGTPNVPGIVGLGEACRLRGKEMGVDEPRIAGQRDRLQTLLVNQIVDLVVNGDISNRLGNNLHVSAPGVPNDAVLARLRRRIAISTGAACMSGAHAPSHVLDAMGLGAQIQEGALRISLGKFTTDDEIALAADLITDAVIKTRDAMSSSSRSLPLTRS